MKTVHVVLYSRCSSSSADFIGNNLETSAELCISGALDGISDNQLQEMAANPIATGVPVEMADGSWLYVSHSYIDQCARRAIEKLQAEGAETVLMCCTIPWRSLEDIPGVLCPSLLLESNAVSIMPRGGTLGVVQPDAITAPEEIKHWVDLGVPVLARSISPQENTAEELVTACVAMVEDGADIIVLDCLAFSRDHWHMVRKATGKPVLLPISLVGKILDEAYG